MSLNRMILYNKLKDGLCKIVTKFNVTKWRSTKIAIRAAMVVEIRTRPKNEPFVYMRIKKIHSFQNC